MITTGSAPVGYARRLEVFVYAGSGSDDRVAGYVGLLVALATPVAWWLYFRSRRRHKRAAAALATSS